MKLITGKTKLLGLIGDPIEHSLSPVMHNAAIAHLGVDYVYIPLPVQGKDLETAIASFEAIGLVGFNVTIPHKQAILPFLSSISTGAQLVGAANTIWRTEKGWSGTNTDVEGFLAPLKNISLPWTEVTPIILGNGGAARAVVVGCAQLGCPQIYVIGRNKDKLTQFKQTWSEPRLKDIVIVDTFDNLEGLVSKTKLIVNTTPIGMYPTKIEELPIKLELIKKLPTGAIAYDLIYNPRPTKFLQLAAEAGLMAIDGLEMLVQQGAAALKIWLNQEVPIDVMRQALLKYLRL